MQDLLLALQCLEKTFAIDVSCLELAAGRVDEGRGHVCDGNQCISM